VLRFELGRAVCAGRAAVVAEPPSPVADQARTPSTPDAGPTGGAWAVAVASGRGSETGRSGARAVAVTGATGAASADTVELVSPGPRAARNAAPIAAVSCGRGVVATGTRRCRE